VAPTGPVSRCPFIGADRKSRFAAVRTGFDPDLWSGRAEQEDFEELAVSGLASMYPTFDWSVVLRAIMDISARLRSH
jgi:hypothetical protein